MLDVSNLECVRGELVLFSGLQFSLQPGELIHVKGANGTGKTTLLRTLCGLRKQEHGEICWEGRAIEDVRDDYNRSLTYIGHYNGVKDELTAMENLQVAGRLAGERYPEDAILDALQRIGLRGREDLPAQVLSQGQRRRVALARLLLSRTRLWVLDEPYTALDVNAVSELSAVIARHLAGGGMVLLTTHQDVDIDGVVRQLDLGGYRK